MRTHAVHEHAALHWVPFCYFVYKNKQSIPRTPVLTTKMNGQIPNRHEDKSSPFLKFKCLHKWEQMLMYKFQLYDMKSLG